MKSMITRKEFIGAAMAAGAVTACAGLPKSGRDGRCWYRGMLHMHTLWSDGRVLPEQAVAAYKDAGYDFVAVTDHNRLGVDPDRYVAVGNGTEKGWPPLCVHPDCYRQYMERFGKTASVRKGEGGGLTHVRLKTIDEIKAMFDEKGKFLVLPGVELTTDVKEGGVVRSMHMNVIGIDDGIERAKRAKLIEFLPGRTVASAIRESRELSEALAKARNRSCLCMVNHPHWICCDVLARDIIDNPEIRYFEVCNNGSRPSVPAELDGEWYQDSSLWDAVLAYRRTHGQQMLYGFGSDDTHFYPGSGLENPYTFGDGYIMVRSEALTQEALFDAIHRGDFYASSELDLEDVSFDGKTRTLSVSVPATPGVACRIRFITTKKGAPLDPVSYVDITPEKVHMDIVRKVPIYDDQIGATVKLVEGRKGERLEASYQLASDDLYVRARVESDAPTQFKRRRSLHPAHHTAWTQPYC